MITVERTGQRLGRLERPAITGVLVREVVNFSSYWRAATFSSTVEPTIYLLAFGFGFGSLVSRVGGFSYVQFVGTGTVATAVLFSSAFAAYSFALSASWPSFAWIASSVLVSVESPLPIRPSSFPASCSSAPFTCPGSFSYASFALA